MFSTLLRSEVERLSKRINRLRELRHKLHGKSASKRVSFTVEIIRTQYCRRILKEAIKSYQRLEEK